MPDTSLLFGPLLIGTFFNTILYGVSMVQSFIYFRTYKRDAAWIRYFVLYLFILETLNTGFVIGMMYEPLVINYGEPKSLRISPKMLVADPLMTSLISTSAQFFIARRIRIISRSTVIPLVICFLGICALAGGIALSICVALVPQYVRFLEFKGAIITWLAASALADILITITLTWTLIKRKTGIKETDDKVAKIIRLTLHTGFLTATLAIADVVVFLIVPHTTLNFIWDLPLSKMYTNALLSTLNARSAWNGLQASGPISDNQNVLFGRIDSSGLTAQSMSAFDTRSPNRTDAIELETKDRPKHSAKQRSLADRIAITTIVDRLDDPALEGNYDKSMHDATDSRMDSQV